ncbi:MAG: pyridoxal phosphate-dependent aminotransferase [Bacteroidota bacterium]
MIIPPSNRLNTTEEYYFSRKLKEIALLDESGIQVINLGIGSPDMMPPEKVIMRLSNSIELPDVHGYQPYQGIAELKTAIAGFSKQHFDIDLAPKEILPLIGSKEGIMHISWSYLNPGDKVLIPALGYPTYSSVTRLAGGEPIYFPLVQANNWEPDWDFLEKLDYKGVKLLWINYPHMPTGTKGNEDNLKRFIELANVKGLLICHDNPYSFILNDNPVSILSVDGAREVAIELNSLSKTFNMAGWRIGWVSGQSKYLEPILKVKSNIDSGMFKPLQLAAVEALNLDQSWMMHLNSEYKKRRDLVYQMLDKLKCTYSKDQAGLFVWAKVPRTDGIVFSDALLQNNRVFVTPGIVFGEAGRDYIRISLCSPEEQLKEAIARIP